MYLPPFVADMRVNCDGKQRKQQKVAYCTTHAERILPAG